MPLRQQVHGDDPVSDNHKQQLQFEAGDSPNLEAHAVRHIVCHKTRSQGIPSDRHGTRLSDIPRQRACCVPQGVARQSAALSVSTLQGRQGRCRYRHGKGRVPDCTSSYSSLVPAG